MLSDKQYYIDQINKISDLLADLDDIASNHGLDYSLYCDLEKELKGITNKLRQNMREC